jgi:hypothetical protein
MTSRWRVIRKMRYSPISYSTLILINANLQEDIYDITNSTLSGTKSIRHDALPTGQLPLETCAENLSHFLTDMISTRSAKDRSPPPSEEDLKTARKMCDAEATSDLQTARNASFTRIEKAEDSDIFTAREEDDGFPITEDDDFDSVKTARAIPRYSCHSGPQSPSKSNNLVRRT